MCSSVRLIQERAISNPNHDMSCTFTLLAILLVQIIERCGLFLELLHSNYMIEIVVGSKSGDDLLRTLLGVYYVVSFKVIGVKLTHLVCTSFDTILATVSVDCIPVSHQILPTLNVHIWQQTAANGDV